MNQVLGWIESEAARAEAMYGSPSSAHESLGVLLEEFEELREAIHQNDAAAIEREAIQVAAVALRLADATHRRLSSFMGRSGL